MTTPTTTQARPAAEPTFWYQGSTAASPSDAISFSVVDLRGSTVEADVDGGIVEDLNWAEVLHVASKTSFAFLADEPDLYED